MHTVPALSKPEHDIDAVPGVGSQPKRFEHTRPVDAPAIPRPESRARFAGAMNGAPAADLTHGPAPDFDLSDMIFVTAQDDGLYYEYMATLSATLSPEQELHVDIDYEGEQAWTDGFRSLMARLVEDHQLVRTLAITWLPGTATMGQLQASFDDAVRATWVAGQFAEFGFSQVRSATLEEHGSVKAVFQRPNAG
jgi:hypothetical protein